LSEKGWLIRRQIFPIVRTRFPRGTLCGLGRSSPREQSLLISARYLLLENEIDNQIHLASAEMLPTTSPRLAIINAGTSSRSSQPRRGRVHQRFAKVNAENLR